MAESRPCEACKAKIFFKEGPKGRPIPVQEVTLAYYKDSHGKLARAKVVDGFGAEVMSFFVSHFQTCPEPEKFSRKPRE